MNLCECGCGRPLSGREPSLWFVDPSCAALFTASAYEANPPEWRAEQRLRFVLVAEAPGWGDGNGDEWWGAITDDYLVTYYPQVVWLATSDDDVDSMPEDFMPTVQQVMDELCRRWHRRAIYDSRNWRHRLLARVEVPNPVTV